MPTKKSNLLRVAQLTKELEHVKAERDEAQTQLLAGWMEHTSVESTSAHSDSEDQDVDGIHGELLAEIAELRVHVMTMETESQQWLEREQHWLDREVRLEKEREQLEGELWASWLEITSSGDTGTSSLSVTEIVSIFP